MERYLKVPNHWRVIGLVWLAVACTDSSTAPTPASFSSVNAVPFPPTTAVAVIQAATYGPNGQILQPPTTYAVCGFGTLSYSDSTGVVWTKDCDTRWNYASSQQTYGNYNGGSVSVFIQTDDGPVHLGTIKANWERLTVYGYDSSMPITMTAWPEQGYAFDNWTDHNGMYTTPTIVRYPSPGAEYLALLRKLPPPNGDPPGGGDPCIICG